MRNSGQFQAERSVAAIDSRLLKTATEFICKQCLQVFPLTRTGNAQRSARRHVTTHLPDTLEHEKCEIPADTDEGGIDQPYANDYADMDIDDLLHAAEENQPINESFPAVLFGLLYIRFGFSKREADALLRLLKLNLNFSGVKNAKDVLKLVGVAEAVERAACRECDAEGFVNNTELTCGGHW